MTPKRIVSIGECMVEMAPLAAAGTYGQGFAGDTFNTAWYLARLRPDWHIDYLTDVGRDAMSDGFVDFVARAGVGTSQIVRHDDATLGLYLISLQDGERSFAYWRGQAAAKRLADDPARLDAAFAGADVLYLSGITLGILSARARERLLAALTRARAAGAKVAFDPNLRPRLWPDTATMCDAVMAAAAVSDIAMPSHEDEASFFGDANPDATLDRYRQASVIEVVVKNGADHIVFCDGGDAGRFDPAPVPAVIDSTAAGDSFNAGYLVARLSGASQSDACTQAAALAARVIGVRGALLPPEV